MPDLTSEESAKEKKGQAVMAHEIYNLRKMDAPIRLYYESFEPYK